MPTTPKLILPYPNPTDPADVPADIQSLATKVDTIAGAASGIATLDGSGKVPTAQLPPISSIDYIGDWAAGVTYQPGHVARYGGVDYLAVNPSTGQVPPASTGFGGGGVIYRKATPKAVNTSAAATDLLNGEITVAAGAMGTAKLLRLTAWGDFVNNTGANTPPPRFQLLLGGVMMIDTGPGTPGSMGAGPGRTPWKIVAEILNLGAANAQMVAFLNHAQAVAVTLSRIAFTVGNGLVATDGNAMLTQEGVNTGLAVNTALAAALVLNVLNGNAGALYETRLLAALAEVV